MAASNERRMTRVKFCLECVEYCCSSCLPCHGKYVPNVKDHTVEDVSGSNDDFHCTIELGTPTDVKLPSEVPSMDHTVEDASGSSVAFPYTVELATPTDVKLPSEVPSIDHTVEDVSWSNVEFLCTIELGTPTDVQTPAKARLVRLASGSFLVCDWYNKAMKMLDGNYVVVDEVRFTEYPHTVCVFNENEVAVSLRDKKEIVFVTLDNGLRLSSRQPVKTEGACRGMAYVNGDLYVATGGGKNEGPGKVEVYAISGRRIIDTDAGGNRLFGAPITFAVNPTGSEMLDYCVLASEVA